MHNKQIDHENRVWDEVADLFIQIGNKLKEANR